MGITSDYFEQNRESCTGEEIDPSMLTACTKRYNKEYHFETIEIFDTNDFSFLNSHVRVFSGNAKAEKKEDLRKLIMCYIELKEKEHIINSNRFKKGIKVIKDLAPYPFNEVEDKVLATALDGERGKETRYFIEQRNHLKRIECTLKMLPVEEYNHLSIQDKLCIIMDAWNVYGNAVVPYSLIPKDEKGIDVIKKALPHYFETYKKKDLEYYLRPAIYNIFKDQRMEYYNSVKVGRFKTESIGPTMMWLHSLFVSGPKYMEYEDNGILKRGYRYTYRYDNKELIEIAFTELMALLTMTPDS